MLVIHEKDFSIQVKYPSYFQASKNSVGDYDLIILFTVLVALLEKDGHFED